MGRQDQARDGKSEAIYLLVQQDYCGRGVFCSVSHAGAEIHYGVFARGNGRFFQPDGHDIPIRNMSIYVERGRNLMAFDKVR